MRRDYEQKRPTTGLYRTTPRDAATGHTSHRVSNDTAAPAICHTIRPGSSAMWLRTKARDAKAAWEKILLDELFLFSGGLEGAWSCADGWTENIELPAEGRQRRRSREGNTSERQRCAAEKDGERAGVLLKDSQVVGLLLGCNGLRGAMSPSLGLLSTLRVLDLSGNSLKGTLDPICALRSIEVINLSSNFLTGSISNKIGSLSTLQQLFLSENKLSGVLPDSLSSLLQLHVLCFDGNAFSGRLPPGVASLPKLAVLALQSNKLSGHMPDLSGLKAIRTLELSGNNFDGEFPSLSALSTMRVLAWQGPGFGRGLSGSLQNILPAIISGQPMQLVRLELPHHNLSGKIPLGLRALARLEILILRGNALQGRLPAWLDQLPFLRHVDLADNCFEGPVPASLATLPHLEILMLHGNKLDGFLPPALFAFFKSEQIRVFSLCADDQRARRDTIVEMFVPPLRWTTSTDKANMCEGGDPRLTNLFYPRVDVSNTKDQDFEFERNVGVLSTTHQEFERSIDVLNTTNQDFARSIDVLNKTSKEFERSVDFFNSDVLNKEDRDFERSIELFNTANQDFESNDVHVAMRNGQ